MGYYKDRWREQPPWIKIPMYVVFGAIAAVVFGLLFGMVVVWLWNALMPVIFGLPEITFWQGVGLFILAKLLLSGFGNSHGESKKHPKPPRPHMPPRPPHWGEPCGPMGYGPMEPPEPKRDAHGWQFYDEWWQSEGKASFDTYVEQMRPTPPPKEEPKEDE